MESPITKRNKRNLEYYKNRYLEALKTVESDEEMRLAMIHQPKFNLHNIMHYSAYMHGARDAMIRFYELYKPKSKSEDKIYTDAVFKLITSDIRYTGLFLQGGHDIRYRNHKRNSRGRLESVEAYFADKVSIYREVEV